MINDQQKAVDVLTRCGPFSKKTAEQYLESIDPEHAAELVAIYDRLEINPSLRQGGRFDDLLHNVADQLVYSHPPAKEDEPKPAVLAEATPVAEEPKPVVLAEATPVAEEPKPVVLASEAGPLAAEVSPETKP